MDKPRVVTANVATLDGRIAASSAVPAWRDANWAPIGRAGIEIVDVRALHGAKVTLEGSNSFVAREAQTAPWPDVTSREPLYEDFLPSEVMARFETWMAVPDSRGRVVWTQKEGGGTHVLALASASTPPGYLAYLRDQDIPYLLAGDDRVDLGRATVRLGETFGTEVIVSTAGGVLNGALLRAGLVDEVDLQVLPIVLGIPDAPAIFEGYGAGSPMRLTLLHQESRDDGSLFLRFAPDKQLV